MNPNHLPVKFKRLTTAAVFPSYGSDGAAGMDLCADLTSICPDLAPRGLSFVLCAGDRALIKTGFAIQMEWEGYEAQVRPRSGLALKHGITVLNSPGTIDNDYRGEIGVILYNTGRQDFVIKQGDRIAQLVFAKVSRADITFVDIKQELDSTFRGEAGFGSTGVK